MFRKIVVTFFPQNLSFYCKFIKIVKHEQTAPMHIVNHIRQFLRPEEIVATIRVSKEWKDTVTDVRVEKLSFTRSKKKPSTSSVFFFFDVTHWAHFLFNLKLRICLKFEKK